MNKTDKKAVIGYAFCASFCTLKRSFAELCGLSAEYELYPIFSEKTRLCDTRFGRAEDFVRSVEELCGREAIISIEQAEKIGPSGLFDAMIISPCTGNTLAKLANGITDGAVTMAAKAHLRNGKPLVLALASNDALSAGLGNIAALVQRKNIFFVPFGQDDCFSKPNSLVADFTLTASALECALEYKQLQPILKYPMSAYDVGKGSEAEK